MGVALSALDLFLFLVLAVALGIWQESLESAMLVLSIITTRRLYSGCRSPGGPAASV